MPDRVIHSIPRRDGEEVRATLGEYRGKTYASLRVYFRADDDSWRPSKAGIAIDVERFSELEDAIDALRKAIHGEGKRIPKQRYGRGR